LRGRLQSLPTNTKPHKYLKSPFQVCKSLRGHADQAVFLSETYGSGPTYDEDLATIRRAADDARRWLRDMREPTLEEAMVRVDQFRAVALPPLKVRRRASQLDGWRFGQGLLMARNSIGLFLHRVAAPRG